MSAPTLADWYFDPARTIEERFGAQKAIEWAMNDWRARHGIPAPQTAPWRNQAV